MRQPSSLFSLVIPTNMNSRSHTLITQIVTRIPRQQWDTSLLRWRQPQARRHSASIRLTPSPSVWWITRSTSQTLVILPTKKSLNGSLTTLPKEATGQKLSPAVEDANVELTAGFWHNVTEAMEKDHSVFQDFWSKQTRGFNVSTCTGDCITNELCALRGANTQYSCYKPPSRFSKRDQTDDGMFQERECDHSEAASVFEKITQLDWRAIIDSNII